MNKELIDILKLKRHYILGLGRSGTTLLVNVLNRNKNVLAPPESIFIQFFYAAFKNKNSFTKNDVDSVLDFVKTNERLFPLIDWNFDYPFFNTLEYPLQMNYDAFINLIHLQFIPPEGRKKEIHCIIDKNPGNSIFGDELLKINLNSKAVILVRDYRAYLLSLKEKKYWRATGTVYNAKRWQLFYSKLFKLNKQHPEKTLFVRYEDIVSNNEVIIKKIFDFLDIPFSTEMLTPIMSTFTKKELEEKYDYLSPQHIEILKNKISAVNRPIYNDHLNKWKKSLQPKDIAQSDVICSELGSHFNYEKFKPEMNSSFLLKCSPQYLKGTLSIIKQQILFALPYGIKLWRLKQIVTNTILQEKIK